MTPLYSPRPIFGHLDWFIKEQYSQSYSTQYDTIVCWGFIVSQM